MDYGNVILGGAIGLSVVIAAFGLIKVLLRKRAKPEVVDEELSLSAGSIKGAFLFRCVVKNNGAKPCFLTDVEITLPKSKKIRTGGRANLYSPETDARSRASSTEFPVIVSEAGQIPIRVVGKADFKSGRYPSRGKVKVRIGGRRKPITKDFEVNNRYLITRHRFK